LVLRCSGDFSCLEEEEGEDEEEDTAPATEPGEMDGDTFNVAAP
jgi:hypothetical protein